MNKCNFCEKDAVTICCDCGKLLCKDHKYTPLDGLSKDRCQNCNNIHLAKRAGQGIIKTAEYTFKAMNYLGKLWG